MDYPRYDPQSPVTPLDAAEIAALDRLLQNLPADGTMTLDGMDGFLTALQVGPPELLATWPTADWLPWVWGGDGPLGNEAATPFASKRQRKDSVVLLLRHLRHLGEQFATAPDAWEPIFSVAEKGADEWVDASDWCAGFLQGVDLMPDAWGDVWRNAELTPLLMLGGGLEGVPLETTLPENDVAAIDAASRSVPEAVLALHARWHGEAGVTP
jgi:uncharacterized protein